MSKKSRKLLSQRRKANNRERHKKKRFSLWSLSAPLFRTIEKRNTGEKRNQETVSPSIPDYLDLARALSSLVDKLKGGKKAKRGGGWNLHGSMLLFISCIPLSYRPLLRHFPSLRSSRLVFSSPVFLPVFHPLSRGPAGNNLRPSGRIVRFLLSRVSLANFYSTFRIFLPPIRHCSTCVSPRQRISRDFSMRLSGLQSNWIHSLF